MHLTRGLLRGVAGYDSRIIVPAGGSYSAEATTLFAAMTSSPDNTRKTLIDNVIVALKSTASFSPSIWSRLDALHILAAGNAHDALLNWKNPGTYDCTAVNAPTFAADAGYTGGSTKRLDTNFAPGTASSPNLVQNSACVFAWGNTTGAIAGPLFGTAGGNLFSVFPRYTDDNSYFRNGEVAGVHVSNTDGSGLFAADRAASATVVGYRNGSQTISSGSISTALDANNLVYLAEIGSALYYTGTILAAGFGSSLDATAQAALYSALHPYMQSVAFVA